MRRLSALIFLISGVAQADELPTNLLLRCQGKETTLLTFHDRKPETLQNTFDVTLRLKDRTIGDIRFNFLEGEGCTSEARLIKCALDKVFPFEPLVNSTEKRHTSVAIDRDTGEYHYSLETWGYAGKTTIGKPISHRKTFSSGICHPSGGPVY